MDQLLVMCILQSRGCLLDIGDDGGEWQPRTARMAEAQRTTWGILHYQKRGTCFHSKIKDTHDVGVLQVSEGLRLP